MRCARCGLVPCVLLSAGAARSAVAGAAARRAAARHGIASVALLSSALAACSGAPAPTAEAPAANEAAATTGAAAAPPELKLPSGLGALGLSGNVPLSVGAPAGLSPEQARPWFDVFSWRSFVALSWPASTNQRGVPLSPDDPSVFSSPPAGSAEVWSTYRAANDLFGQGSRRPTPWNGALPKTCGQTSSNVKSLLMVGKGGPVLDDVNEAFSFPLIDQFKNYVWAEVRFNQAEYDFIRGQDANAASWLYLAKNLAKAQPISMPASVPGKAPGALTVKASWRVMTPQDDASRYYTVQAEVYDYDRKKCDPKKMGLVGLHIVQKLSELPEWVWSSFEQVDNVALGPGAQGVPSFNNGTDNPKTVGGYANRPKSKVPPLEDEAERQPVQVTRFNPIPDTPAGASTQDINRAYQALLGETVWRFYQLVITQWPTQPESFMTKESGGVYPANAGQPFPVEGCTNTALETYLQSAADAAGAGGNSCMSCHYGAGQSDFSWVLQRRAH